MKQSLLLYLLPFAVSVASAQPTPERGDKFLKRIENNYSSGDIYVEADGSRHGDYNFGSKGRVERLFFGDFNAPVEYFLDPSFEASREGAIGFRVYPDSAGRQILEVKYIPNYEEAYRQLSMEYERIPYDREFYTRFYDELPKCFRIASKKIYIGDTLAIRLYDRIMQAVRDYASPGKPMRSNDGESVTFRGVVGHDLWTLTIRSPWGEMDKLSSLCKRIISDVRGGSLDENTCLRQLGD